MCALHTARLLRLFFRPPMGCSALLCCFPTQCYNLAATCWQKRSETTFFLWGSALFHVVCSLSSQAGGGMAYQDNLACRLSHAGTPR